MAKYVVGIITLILAGGIGWYLWTVMGGLSKPEASEIPEVQEPATQTYEGDTFSVEYPLDFAADPTYFYDQFEGKPIDGVKFAIPGSMATGTNLSADSYVSVEQLPRAINCTGAIYVVPNVRNSDMSDQGVSYSVASTTEAAAGNRYEEQVWAIKGSEPCTAVRYFIHTTELANYEPGTVQAYDRAALLAAFDSIRRSVQLASDAATATTTP
jgi:hypothetical protein